MIIRTMSVEDLAKVLGWAEQEGWNPGLDDAPAFHAADPDGFFLVEMSGVPAAAISVVNHCDTQAFLGLYICRPEFRRRGIGFALWQAALQHAGDRAIGLDGVPDQQENYARSGFRRISRSVRFQGDRIPSDAPARPASEADLTDLLAADRQAVGHDRPRFSRAWFAPSPTRRTIVLTRGGGLAGFATFRQCHDGVKIGPFQAHTHEDAQTLLAACPAEFPAGPIFVDIPDGSQLRDLVEAAGFRPVFETARMVKGTLAEAAPPAFFGAATLELG